MTRAWMVVVVLAAACGGQVAKDVCAGVDCGVGVCAVAGGAPACVCPSGFEASGTSCRELPPLDRCASNPCASLSQSLCLVRDGVVRCECPQTRVEVAGACLVRTPCTPNPCTRAHRTTCVVEGDAASCLCDPGYGVEGDGCTAAPLWTCDARHADGDASEADECPTLAKPLAFDVDEARTLFPAGDHDWLRLGVTRGSVFTFTASARTLPLLVEVFDVTGTTLLASDNRGAVLAEVSFVAPADAVLVRVRGVRANLTGDYTVRYREVGADDYANTPATAVTLLPSMPFVGEVQYAGDLDVVWLELPEGTAVQLAVPDAGNPAVVFELSRPDGGARVLSPGDRTFVTVPTTEALLLSARGLTARDQGTFSLEFATRGPDDYSDDPAFALPVALGTVLTGTIDGADFDAVKVEQVRDRLYAWVPLTNGTAQLDLAVYGARGQVLASTSWASTSGVAWKAADSEPATVRVGDSWGWTTAQPWSFRVEDLGVDDHSDTLTAATPLTGGVPRAGRLELAGDVDTFSFTAQAGHIMQVTSSSTALTLAMFDAQNQQVAQGTGTVAALAATTGTWRVQVRSGSSSSGLVSYTVTVADLGVDDFGPASPGTVTVGAASSGNLQWSGDVDAFTFTPTAGHVYEATAMRVAGGALAVRVLDPAGATVASNSFSGSTASFLASVGGTWRVEVYLDYSQQPGSFTLSVVDRGVEDHGATQTSATPVSFGVATPGTIGFANDVDAFSFTVTQGRIYAVSTSTSSVRLELRDAQFNYFGSSTSFRAASSGTLFAVVSSWSSSVPAAYTVTVADLGTDDHGDTPAAATVATVGSATAGSVQYSSDVDVLAVTPTTGHFTRAVCTAASTCSLVVRDAGGATLASGSSSVTFKAPPGATVYLSVSAYSAPLAWSVQLSDVGVDDHGDGVSDATVLTLDAGVAGVLEVSNDFDAFRVAPALGQIVQVTVQGAGFSPLVQVLTPNGSVLTQSTYSSTSTVTVGFWANTPGEWTTRVSTSTTGASVSYTVSARTAVDDYPTATSVPVGQLMAGALDYVGDTDVLLVPMTAGTPRSFTLTGNLRGTVTDGSGAWVATLYSGSPRTLTPSTTGTWRVELAFDYGANLVPSWTFIAQ